MRVWLVCGAILTAIAHVGAQGLPVDTIAEARRLRDASDFAGAAALMRPYVDSHPDDPGSARFAALMAYWSKNRASADSIYARALASHGDDADLRLEYGRFLIETGSSSRAREVLEPVARDTTSFTPGKIAQARTLLATADYWAGDFTAARRQFAAALRLDSSLIDARRQLTEIETVSAPWIRLTAGGLDDDQPLRSASIGAEAAWFATPLVPLGIGARSTAFDRDGTAESITAAEVRFSAYLASAHLDVGATAGVMQRSFDRSSDWTGAFTLGARLPGSVVMHADASRAPYTNTLRSLAVATMVQTMDGGLRFGNARSWMGDVLAGRERYPDGNAIATASAWMLAPILRREAATMQVGYAFAAQSANESRFVPRGDVIFPPGQAPATVPGEYNPYYTPRNLRAHSVLGAVRLHANERWSIDTDMRYAISAHDDAPILLTVVTPPNVVVVRDFSRRSFSPWNARGLVGWAATPAVRLTLGAEHGREAYYTYSTARLALVYTFLPAAARHAAVR
jgi:hypothetical protein